MIGGLRAIARSERFKRQRSYSAVWLLLAWGGLIVALLLPDGGALSGLNDPPHGPFNWSDTANHYVAAIAAMRDPIDWSAPLAIERLEEAIRRVAAAPAP